MVDRILSLSTWLNGVSQRRDFILRSRWLWCAVIALSICMGAVGLGHAEEVASTRKGKSSVKVAAVQLNGYDKGELPRAGFSPVTKILPYIERAGKDQADIVVFPEYVLGHIAVPSDTTRKISRAAAAAKTYVVVGCWELHKGDHEGPFSNTILLFGRDGKIIGKYHKTHPAIDHFDGQPAWKNPPSGKTKKWFLENDPEWIMRPGEQLPVFDLDFGKIGILTCYDGWFPEPARVLSLKGAEVILWVNGRGGQVEDFIVRSTMFQSLVAMVTTNQAYGAGTMIGQWPARIVARAKDREESYITGTIQLTPIRKARANSRNFRQRRPDLYKALVAPKEPSQPVELEEPEQ